LPTFLFRDKIRITISGGTDGRVMYAVGNLFALDFELFCMSLFVIPLELAFPLNRTTIMTDVPKN
jgi:hypothetical protein